MKMRKLVLAVVFLLIMLIGLTACGDNEEIQANNTTEYESENLGFAISMDEELFAIITYDAYQEGYDDKLGAHKWKNTISAEFDGVSVPLLYVNVYDGEFDEQSIEKQYPDDVYLGLAEGFTYTMTFSVDGDGAKLNNKDEYQEIMEKYVYDLPNYTMIFGYGDALLHESEISEAKLAWVTGLSSDGTELEIDPVIMVVEGDEENTNKMKAAGVTPDFSLGYMIWNEKEEQAKVALADDVKVYLLDANYSFVEVTAEELQNRIAEGDLMISYLTKSGQITEIYEQYLDV